MIGIVTDYLYFENGGGKKRNIIQHLEEMGYPSEYFAFNITQLAVR